MPHDKEPTPLRPRAHEPQPLQLPTRATFEERLRRTVLHILYDLLRSDERIDIATMTYDEFEDFAERVRSDEA